jgi:hypothetical protein
MITLILNSLQTSSHLGVCAVDERKNNKLIIFQLLPG